MTQSIQLFKAQKTNRINKKQSLKKSQRKGLQKKKLIDTQIESNINTVAEELVSSENAKGG